MANDAKNTGATAHKTPDFPKKTSSNEPIDAKYVARDRTGNKSAPVYKLDCTDMPATGDTITIKVGGSTAKAVVKAVDGKNATLETVAST